MSNRPWRSGQAGHAATQVAGRLHDPHQPRAVVTAAVLLGRLPGHLPAAERPVEDATVTLNHENRLLELARNVEFLRAQYGNFAHRLPKQCDAKESGAIRLGGIRGYPLKLNALDCQPPRQVGPYRAVVMRVELEGDFFAMDAFLLCWLESIPLFRADSLGSPPR